MNNENLRLLEDLCIDIYAHELNNELQIDVPEVADRVINVLHGDPEAWREANEQKIKERLHAIRLAKGWNDDEEESF